MMNLCWLVSFFFCLFLYKNVSGCQFLLFLRRGSWFCPFLVHRRSGLIRILLTRLHNCLFRSEHSFLKEKSPLTSLSLHTGERREGSSNRCAQTSRSGQKGIRSRSGVHPDSQREDTTSVFQATFWGNMWGSGIAVPPCTRCCHF